MKRQGAFGNRRDSRRDDQRRESCGDGARRDDSRREFHSGNGRGQRFDRRSNEETARRLFEQRPKWQPPVPPSDPLPIPACAICGKPVRDIASAVNDQTLGTPAHFDCIIKKIIETEHLEKGESVAYIGGGRFGIVRFGGSREKPPFKIQKIFEWEDKDNRAEWRKTVSDHYSLT